MTENLYCTNAFELLDEYDHEFIDVVFYNNDLFINLVLFYMVKDVKKYLQN